MNIVRNIFFLPNIPSHPNSKPGESLDTFQINSNKFKNNLKPLATFQIVFDVLNKKIFKVRKRY